MKGCQSRKAGGLGSCWKEADETRTKTAHVKDSAWTTKVSTLETRSARSRGLLCLADFIVEAKKKCPLAIEV